MIKTLLVNFWARREDDAVFLMNALPNRRLGTEPLTVGIFSVTLNAPRFVRLLKAMVIHPFGK